MRLQQPVQSNMHPGQRLTAAATGRSAVRRSALLRWLGANGLKTGAAARRQACTRIVAEAAAGGTASALAQHPWFSLVERRNVLGEEICYINAPHELIQLVRGAASMADDRTCENMRADKKSPSLQNLTNSMA